jgi:cell division protein FtsL
MTSFIESGKLSWMLWLAIVLSAFAIINSSYYARQKFIQWQILLSDAQDYEVEWGQLLLEKSTMASYARLESMAADALNMTEPKKDQIVVIEAHD